MTRYSVQPRDQIFVKGFVWISKEQFKKQQKQLVIWLVIKLLIKLRGFQKIHNKIIRRQLELSMIKKYLKKDIYL